MGSDVPALVSRAPEGATFWFEPGVHRLASEIIPKTNQKFYGAEGAIVSGAKLLQNFTQEAGKYVIGGQTQQGERRATDAGDDGFMRAGYPDAVYLDNKPLKPVDALSKVTAGTFFFDYNTDKIYLADNPAGHTVEAAVARHAFAGTAANVTVANLVIEKFASPAQLSAIQGGKGWVVQNNEVRLNYGTGIAVEDNSKMVGNYVHDNGQMGLDAGGANVLVENNEIARNGFWSGIDPFWEGGGTKFAETTNLIVRGNYSHDNNGFGLWTDINNYNTLYENNLVVNNSGGGINHEISYDAVIRNNTLIGNG